MACIAKLSPIKCDVMMSFQHLGGKEVEFHRVSTLSKQSLPQPSDVPVQSPCERDSSLMEIVAALPSESIKVYDTEFLSFYIICEKSGNIKSDSKANKTVRAYLYNSHHKFRECAGNERSGLQGTASDQADTTDSSRKAQQSNPSVL